MPGLYVTPEETFPFLGPVPYPRGGGCSSRLAMNRVERYMYYVQANRMIKRHTYKRKHNHKFYLWKYVIMYT